MIKTFHVMGGLPRSGQTLLSSILQQHPCIHATQNSALINIMWKIWDEYDDAEQTKAFKVDQQLEKTMFYAAHGFYAHIDKTVIIDKSRGWGHNVGVIQKGFPTGTKFIATVRPIPDILASFIQLCDNNPENYIDKTLKDNGIPITNENRCEWLVSKNGTLFESWDSLKFGMEHYKDNMLFVEYNDLVAGPQHTLDVIYDFLDIKSFKHDFSNIINHTPEDDTVYGIKDMHTIRKRISPKSINPVDILGKELYYRYNGGHFWR